MPVMSDGKVQVGADRLEEWLADLDGCRVALAVNQTSLLSASSVHLVDTLLARGINVVALFAPEHGLRGTADAGEILSDSRDARTGLPIYSLYGMNKKPSGRQLKDIDVLISTFRMSVLVFILIFPPCIISCRDVPSRVYPCGSSTGRILAIMSMVRCLKIRYVRL